MKKLSLFLCLIFMLTGCSYNGQSYFGEDNNYVGTNYFGDSDDKNDMKVAYQPSVDYLLEDFNTKEVTSRKTRRVTSYDFIETSISLIDMKTSKDNNVLGEPVSEQVSVASNDTNYTWNGSKLTKQKGVNQGPSGKETYYNLDMSGCIKIMKSLGYDYEYTVRSDGVKLYGGYVMIAADLSIRPKGTKVPTSLGMGIVVDTGAFVKNNSTQIDIAVTW